MREGFGGTGKRRNRQGSPQLLQAWRVILVAGLAGVGMAIVWLVLIFFLAESEEPQLRLAAVLFQAGYLLLRSLIAYGVYFRVRWAAWLGGVVAGVTAVRGISYLLSGQLALASPDEASLFVDNAFMIALRWAELVVDASFLAGIYLVRRAHRTGA